MKVKTYFSSFFVITIVLFSTLEESLAATKPLTLQTSKISDRSLEQPQKTIVSMKDEIGRATIRTWQVRASSMTLASKTEECTVGKEKIHCP